MSTAVDQLLDFYDEFAPHYDGWAGGVHRRVAARLAELAAPARKEHALDVGTGTGLVALDAAKRVGRGGHVMGVDLSEAMLAVARRAAVRPAAFAGMAAEALVFRDGTFDLVTMGDCLTYVSDPPRALAEAHRVLRAGGRLAVSVPRRSLCTPAQDLFFELLEDFLRRHPLRIPRHRGERAVMGEPEVLADLLRDFGFEDVRTSALVTGWRLKDGRAWISHLLGAGPYTHAALTALGPALQAQLAAELDEALESLGEDRGLAHHGYTLAIAAR